MYFQVFTAAAADDRKSIVLLAFETMEKIVRDYFPYITETETTTFTDCVKCLITFTSSKFSSDASLNAIAFLRFCAVKLAEEGFICHDKDTKQQPNNLDSSEGNSTVQKDDHSMVHKDDDVYFWVPLLAGILIFFLHKIKPILLEKFRNASHLLTYFLFEFHLFQV